MMRWVGIVTRTEHKINAFWSAVNNSGYQRDRLKILRAYRQNDTIRGDDAAKIFLAQNRDPLRAAV